MINRSYNVEFKKALITLCYAWGGDAPPEAVWAANEMMALYCKMNMIPCTVELDESTENYEEFESQIDG